MKSCKQIAIEWGLSERTINDLCKKGKIDGKPVKIYDRERTICDLLLHRNKVDGEVFNVAIQRYVQYPKKVEARLMKYAKLLHVEKR